MKSSTNQRSAVGQHEPDAPHRRLSRVPYWWCGRRTSFRKACSTWIQAYTVCRSRRLMHFGLPWNISEPEQAFRGRWLATPAMQAALGLKVSSGDSGALSGQSPRPRGDACRLRPGPAPGHKGTLQWPPGASIHSCSDSGGAGRQTRLRLIAKSCLLISATFAASAGVSIGLTVRPTGHLDKAWRIKGTGRFHNGFQTL